MIVLRRLHNRRRAVVIFGKNRRSRLGFDAGVREELGRIQHELGAFLEWLENVVIAIVCGQRNRRPAAIFRDKNLLSQFRGEFCIAVPPVNVRVLAENHQLALPGLSHLIQALADFVGKPRYIIDDDHFMPGNLFRRHARCLHDVHFKRQIRGRCVGLAEKELCFAFPESTTRTFNFSRRSSANRNSLSSISGS